MTEVIVSQDAIAEALAMDEGQYAAARQDWDEETRRLMDDERYEQRRRAYVTHETCFTDEEIARVTGNARATIRKFRQGGRFTSSHKDPAWPHGWHTSPDDLAVLLRWMESYQPRKSRTSFRERQAATRQPNVVREEEPLREATYLIREDGQSVRLNRASADDPSRTGEGSLRRISMG